MKAVNTRLVEVEKGVARLEAVPEGVNALAQQTRDVRDDLVAIRGAKEKLQDLEESVGVVSKEVTDVNKKATEQEKVAERAAALLKTVSDNLDDQLKEIEGIKRRVAQLDDSLQKHPPEGNRYYVQFALKDKPDEQTKVADLVVLIFREPVALPSSVPFETMAVEHIELKRGDGQNAPSRLVVTAEVDKEKRDLLISLYARDNLSVLDELSKQKIVVTATLVRD